MVVGDLETAVDVLVLGAGPAGYAAAIRAAQLGKQVALVDPGKPGGTCLHEGCIPAKALLSAAERAWQIPALAEMGIMAGPAQVDMVRLQSWKNGVVAKLTNGVGQLLARHKVQIVAGKGWFIPEPGVQRHYEVRVEEENGSQRFSFEHCIIAVGGSPAPLAGLAYDGARVLTTSQALRLSEIPWCMAVIGGDYIAVELATLFAKLGVAVRLLVPAGQEFLGEFDSAATRLVRARLKKLGARVEMDVADLAAAVQETGCVVVSNGIVPNTADLHLEVVGVAADSQGFLLVNDRMRTTNPAIYAVGDVTGGFPLATIAFKQGKVAAEALAGLPAQYAPQAIPRVAWTDPELATVGLTAREATAAGYTVVTGRFPLAANGRALTLEADEGMVMTVAERESGVLLGVTIAGTCAAELIGEAALALEMGATLLDLAETLHPHPSLSEALQESAEAALHRAIHLFNPA
ncbi:MAG: FAD-dependent oxidoreductase [Chloroflexi bacterium]|nr:FAD-dependent oxidoreductase [Chloroflexota bacterium]